MIEIIGLTVAGSRALQLTFSDGTSALWQAGDVIARDTVLTRPLTDAAYFARAFIGAGSLAWPNGLEFSGQSLHRRLDEAGALIRQVA